MQDATESDVAFLGEQMLPPSGKLAHGVGCDDCRKTGYKGRVGIFELLMIDDPVRARIQARANATEIRSTALERGMTLLRDDGIHKILRGLTTADDVSRVTVRAAI
jgi:type II secretory ATPase GspE/PulE/Tfp pilus assembly ATPase PilB-like protein